MKTQIFALLLQLNLVLLLSGCNLIDGVFNYGKPPRISDDNPFSSVNFPLESCSDSLPEDERAYPVEIYTIFILFDSSKSYISDKLREKYCKNVIISTSDQYESRIQIGSFVGSNRAKKFQEILSRDFENVEISESTIIGTESVNKSSEADNFSQLSQELISPQEIGASALLNEIQIGKLLSIDETLASGRIDGQNRQYPIKVVLPTYIPKGFTLEMLEIKNDERYGNEYRLLYRNFNNNHCFNFRGGFIRQFGGPAVFATTVDANSSALGRVSITIVESNKINSLADYIGFRNEVERRKFGEFEFKSTGYQHEEKYSCKPMNFAESFQFLQPDVQLEDK